MGQGLTVLFVEDDRQVRRAITAALSARGFRVFATDDGHEAIRLLHQERVDVLFTDVVMPDMDGIQLVKEAKRVRPDLKVIMATGYASKAQEAEALAKLLFKPLRANQIETEIRRLVAGG